MCIIKQQTILGAGLFSTIARGREIHVAGLWWFWAAITFPLTGVVLLLWGVFIWRTELRAWWARLLNRDKENGDKDVEAKG